MTVGLVLAAGAARRFGAQKLVAAYRGRPLIRCVVDNVLASSVDGVLVVVGPGSPAVASALEGLPIRTVVNPEPDRGMASSIRVGVSAAESEGADGVLVVLGDQPGVGPGLLDRILGSDPEGRADIVAPEYREGIANPVLFRSPVFPELLKLTGDRGARRLVEREPSRVERVVLDRPVPLDVDTPEDLARLEGAGPEAPPG